MTDRLFNSLIKKYYHSTPYLSLKCLEVGANFKCSLNSGRYVPSKLLLNSTYKIYKPNKMAIKEVLLLCRPKFIRFQSSILTIPCNAVRCTSYLKALQSLSHLWSDQSLAVILPKPLSFTRYSQLFDEFIKTSNSLYVDIKTNGSTTNSASLPLNSLAFKMSRRANLWKVNLQNQDIIDYLHSANRINNRLQWIVREISALQNFKQLLESMKKVFSKCFDTFN
uniref:Uncharacterized protein n=1 Tax=Ditylenchus dipsaci TaxID=166011 RepID=A0A915CZ85_9BILA